MKCDDCKNLFEEFIDGEAAERDAEQIRAHLITCASCADEFETMTAEQEIYARYDRGLEISPSLWNNIAAQTAAESRPSKSRQRFNLGKWFSGLLTVPRYGMAGAMAVLVLGVVLGVMYFRTSPQPVPADKSAGVTPSLKPTAPLIPVNSTPGSDPVIDPATEPGPIYRNASLNLNQKVKKTNPQDESDVKFTDIAYSEIEEKDTVEHIAQAQNLLRSIRNIQTSDSDDAVDVTYEKAMSRRLLSQNEVLRADAEAGGKFPVKTLLSDLEPFLIDIANLPDKTTPSDLRALKDRVQKTEIVAALQAY